MWPFERDWPKKAEQTSTEANPKIFPFVSNKEACWHKVYLNASTSISLLRELK